MAHWFDGARFGMFVHWSHCSQQGRELSWPLVGGVSVLPHSGDVPVAEYYAHAMDLCPKPDAPRGWMALAREAGMRYAVMTAKHHDGFAMFDSAHSELTVAKAAYGGDLVAEFVDAARDEGLRAGLYYSLSDWHHPDYPAFTEADKPYVNFLGKRSDTWDRYVEYLFAQVRELLTNYGPIDLIWFDGGWERSAGEWRTDELESMIRSLQPDILINDRLPGKGDFSTPEQAVPAAPPDGRWETCMTMNRSWGHCPDDRDYRSARELVHTLCETAGKGGNLLLNVSPAADGTLPAEQAERLETIASWMRAHGGAIHDTTAGIEPWRFYGPSTRRGDTIFLHLVMRPYGTFTVRGVPVRRIAAVRHHATGTALAFSTRAGASEELGTDPSGEVTISIPDEFIDPIATVVTLEVAP